MLSEVTISDLLEKSTDESDSGWTLCFIGDSQQKKLVELVAGLKGDGKKISSGFSYWGIGPTMSWAKTSNDPYYPVMSESLQSFMTRWSNIYSNYEGDRSFHYVSLGVGTGKKDKYIIKSLLDTQPDSIYFPVDMSSTMLRIAIQEVSEIERLRGNQILPVQIDFSDRDKTKSLRGLIDQVVPGQPILFSLLGNTLANFQADTELLRSISNLLRPGDLLLIEVASTKDLDEKTKQEAKIEYETIDSFRKFVTSALLQNTDIHINLKHLRVIPIIEEDKAILIKFIYRNETGEDIELMLPDWSFERFLKMESIELHLTRKYTSKGIERIISDNHLSIVDRRVTNFGDDQSKTKFGMDLILLSPEARGDSEDSRPLAVNPWKGFSV
jgi:L-histidine Nalpha-methyltransferase